MSYCAVLDANVLYPSMLRSVLISIAQTGLFWARWTDEINEEWIRNLMINRADLDAARIRRTADLMNAAVRDCRITGYENLVGALDLPDPNDRHVLAAAIKGKADAIVTFNLSDFPEDNLASNGIEALHPDDFLINQLDMEQGLVLQAIHTQRVSLTKMPISADELISSLEHLGLPQTAARLSPMKMLI
jgi:predicted nucleic acid-binding protein